MLQLFLIVTSFDAILGVDVLPRIINGKDVQIGQFLSHVSVQAGTWHGCGGTIIAPKWVVTAAHCMKHPISKYRIVAGVINLKKFNHKPQIIKAVEKIIHPLYKSGGRNHSYNDIGLFRLKKPLKFNKYVKPIQLPKAGFDTEGEAEIVGWGCTGKKRTWILQTAKVPILSHKKCSKFYKYYNKAIEVCAGGNKKGTCAGDSGGAIAKNGLIIGITSHGTGNRPGIFVKISGFIDFITKHVTLP